MDNIGLILPNLSASQLAFEVITQANKISFEGEYECILFPLVITPQCIKPTVAIMNISEIYDFSGILIATNLYSAAQIANLKNAARKIFYVWDLEHLRGHHNYVENMHIYSDRRLEIMTRSESHAKVIYNYCNRHSKIVKDCNIKEMIQ
jgi:hypothetical protein